MHAKKAKIEHLSKINLRYRILQMDGESYLVDADRPFLISYFFPWILSFIPHLAYPLTREEVQSQAPSDLSKALNKKDTQKKGLASAFGGGATAMLLSKAFPIEKYLYFSSHVLNLGILLLVYSLVIGIRIWISIRKPMTNIVNSNHPIKIYLVANDRKHRLLSMMAPTFFAGLVVFSSCAIFSNIAPNFILHIVLLLFLSIFMFSGNVLFFSPVVDYKVKIKPQNSADQYAKSIAVFKLFMKKSVNIYHDVTIPAELSKDGQVHTTQTKEEFDQIYDVEKACKVYNEID